MWGKKSHDKKIFKVKKKHFWFHGIYTNALISNVMCYVENENKKLLWPTILCKNGWKFSGRMNHTQSIQSKRANEKDSKNLNEFNDESTDVRQAVIKVNISKCHSSTITKRCECVFLLLLLLVVVLFSLLLLLQIRHVWYFLWCLTSFSSQH